MHRRPLLSLLLLLGACGHTAPPATPTSAAATSALEPRGLPAAPEPPAAHGSASAAPDSSSPPSSSGPAATASPARMLDDLPALSEDGKTIAIANHQSLGMRGDERLLLDFVDVASERLTRRIIVSDPDHPESTAGATAKAQRVLAEHRWTPLSAYSVEEDPGAPVRQGGVGAPFRNDRASGEGLAIEYREPVLVVRDASTGRELLRKTERAWSNRGGARCPGCDVCPPALASATGVWGARASRVLLVSVQFFGGSDVCTEPPAEYHVVPLPP